jgi:hypothetical protein
MSSIADVSVKIQTSSHPVPSTLSWFGEAVLIVGYLKKLGVLDAIAKRLRFGGLDCRACRSPTRTLSHRWALSTAGLRPLCAPGYTGRKRGQVVRSRTVISQAHSCQWLGSVGNRGNGRYCMELLCWLQSLSVPIARKKPLWRKVLPSLPCVSVEEKERIGSVVSYMSHPEF